ncbi:hypothetical protein OAO01_03415 [Oligoflexia bacterium]|nr:hypothetical protein [Oligoflexia bacterium]
MAEKSFVECIFWGEDFSPKWLESNSNLKFPDSEKNEKGEIGKVGKYRGIPYPYGSASFDVHSPDECISGEWDSPLDIMLDLLAENYTKIRKSGVAEVTILLNIYYVGQCNCSINRQQMQQMIDMEVDFGVSCYADDE